MMFDVSMLQIMATVLLGCNTTLYESFHLSLVHMER